MTWQRPVTDISWQGLSYREHVYRGPTDEVEQKDPPPRDWESQETLSAIEGTCSSPETLDGVGQGDMELLTQIGRRWRPVPQRRPRGPPI